MHFDLTDLRLFAMVADEANLTRAAARHHLSLAAASARIKALEIQAARPLLLREARGVRLTPAGATFLHYALSILRQTEQLKVALQGHGDLRGNLVRIFAITTAITDFLPEVLPGFLARYGAANVDIQEKPNAEIARGVFDDRADIGIVAGQVNKLGLQAIHFSTDRLVLVAARNHRFAKRKRVSFAELRGEDMVGLHQGSTLQLFLAQEADKLNMPLKLRMQASSYDVLCRMVTAGVGVGIVPDSTVNRHRESLQLAEIELSETWSAQERYILVRDLAALSPVAQALIDTLCVHFKTAELKSA